VVVVTTEVVEEEVMTIDTILLAIIDGVHVLALIMMMSGMNFHQSKDSMYMTFAIMLILTVTITRNDQ
jgi:hypothetical protein